MRLNQLKSASFLAVSTLAAIATASCQRGSEPLGQSESAVIGGAEDSGDLAVVAVFVGGLCTGTLVAPRIVLTAAHCVADAIESGNTNFGQVRFGDGRGPWIDTISIVDMTMHRLYNPPAFLQHDIALVRLGRDAPENISPIPMNTRPITEEDIGLEVRVVGFGNNDGVNAEGAGFKRQTRTPLTDVRRRHIGYGDANANTCQGDSGGPTFMTFDGVEVVVGVTSYGSDLCRATSYMTRVDTMWEELLNEVVNAWSGPCQNDNNCVTDESCSFVDPDCDICGMDGICGSNCEQPDRDCPLGGLASDLCSLPSDCESRLCTPAPEDARLTYCAMDCDPSLSNENSGCFAPLTICEDQGDGTGICGFSGLTPGVQGAHCDDPGECRSGICLGEENICVEACGEGLPECSGDFVCKGAGEVDICTIPGDDGACQVGSGPGGKANLFFLLLAFGMLARRRKHRCE